MLLPKDFVLRIGLTHRLVEKFFHSLGLFIMALVSMRELLDHAAANGYGLSLIHI